MSDKIYRGMVHELRNALLDHLREHLNGAEVDPKIADTAFRYLKEAGIISLEVESSEKVKGYLDDLPFQDPENR